MNAIERRAAMPDCGSSRKPRTGESAQRLVSLGVLFAVLVGTGPALGRVILVPDSVPTIQGGIGMALNGDTVLVDTGTYPELLDFQGKLVTVASRFMVNGDTSVIEQTAIDAEGRGNVVTFRRAETRDAVIAGFTIRNGVSTNGSGIYCWRASPTICNNIIENNQSSADGGGIFCADSGNYPLIEGNIIRRNSTNTWGGGVYVCDGSSPTIERNIIIKNGVVARTCVPHLMGPVVFAGRRCSQWPEKPDFVENGGGIVVTNYQGWVTKPLIVNNTIDGNVVDGEGGGIFSNLGAPDIRNNIITSNSNHGIYHTGDTLEIGYNDLWGNLSNTGGALRLGPGSLDLNPLYADPAAEDYHLRAGSPCIDSGDPNSPPDPDSTRADMGAYFYDQRIGIEECPRSVASSRKLDATIVRGVVYLSRDMTELSGNSDRIPRSSLLDAVGRKVLDLRPGTNDVSHLSPGVYFVRRLSAESRGLSAVAKVVVTR